MPELSYRQPGLLLGRRVNDTTNQVRDLQRDLRSLGYLRQGIDGVFGSGTEGAVSALQEDLLMNDGTSSAGDGSAPVSILDYNQGRVANVTGLVDQPLVECISDMLDDSNFPKLPDAADPAAQNASIVSQILAMPSQDVPTPFLVAIMKQESSLRHFCEPTASDSDNFIVTGIDTNDPTRPKRITSRGYGIGQYTLFHHPPTANEVNGLMLDPDKNAQQTIALLREKFDGFVNGPTAGTQADDRLAEFGTGPLRLCKHPSDDPRFMKDCRQCALDAGTVNIQSGDTPLYAGANETYEPTQYYANASYQGVPARDRIGCDWPYALRRYNGSGMNSYHYQTAVLKDLLLQFGIAT
jgi:peptidoglycan hydrolase-like protein with peptidoglycan-binding domain